MNPASFRTKSNLGVFCFVLAPALLFANFMPTYQANASHRSKEAGRMQLTSSSFKPEGEIPAKFSCEGEDISPELNWKNSPHGTKSFALIVHDPDAPRSGGFTHWVAYDIPATVHQIPENVPKGDMLPAGGNQGKNDGDTLGYMGPCPPSGTHRYYFYLYALDAKLNLPLGAKKDDLEKVMKGHVLDKAEVMGRYRKKSGKAA